ncbi:MAG: hypothetical protein HYS08_02005 [Chlamydiae bacterium]|nr:hypothetical protein [Chlamydiota bacterium]MBI3266583.1 hypothetical protein [Chlamydiota bacterium]
MFAKVPLFLIAMGLGYFVLLKGTEEVGFLKHLGNVIAGILIIGSLLGLGLTGFIFYQQCMGKGTFHCPFEKSQAVGDR